MVVAVDVGYGYTKAICRNTRVIFPSVIGKTTGNRLLDDIDFVKSRELIDCLEMELLQSPALPDGAKRQRTIGRKAIIDSGISIHGLDRDRYENFSEFIYLFEAACGLLFQKLGLTNKDLTEDITVITGVPISQYIEDVRSKLENIIHENYDEDTDSRRSLHRIRMIGLHVKPKISDIEYLYEVSGMKVLLQPLGSWQYLVRNEYGVDNQKGIDKSTVCIIDIGTYSTDVLVMRDSKPVSHLTFTVPSAMSKVYESVADYIFDETQSIISISKLMVLNDEDLSRFVLGGKQYDLRPVFNDALNVVGHEIITAVKQKFRSEFDINDYYLTGGGAVYLFPIFTKFFSRNNINCKLVAEKDDLQWANVEGYHRYGLSLGN